MSRGILLRVNYWRAFPGFSRARSAGLAAMTNMRKKLAIVALVCALQYAAAGLGVLWGLAERYGVRWLHGRWSLAGCLAVLMLAAEWLRHLPSRRPATAQPSTPWVCVALGCYAMWLMATEAFFWYRDDSTFVVGVLTLVLFLLSICLLVRAGAWLGVAAAVLFFACSLAMLISNGFSLTGASGFFVQLCS